jgi:hypothetical protein
MIQAADVTSMMYAAGVDRKKECKRVGKVGKFE